MTTTVTAIANPYFDEIEPRLGKAHLTMGRGLYGYSDSLMVGRFGRGEDGSADVDGYLLRKRCVAQYAWAIPSQRAIEAIADYGPVVEMGAGTGYWSWLLRQSGVDVVAYDLHPARRGAEANGWHPDTPRWTKIQKGRPDELVHHADRTLFLCWPPYATDMATRSVAFYDGETVAYVGEGEGGCTGNDDFHEVLERDWKQNDSIDIPHWEGVHDRLTIWRRQ